MLYKIDEALLLKYFLDVIEFTMKTNVADYIIQHSLEIFECIKWGKYRDSEATILLCLYKLILMIKLHKKMMNLASLFTWSEYIRLSAVI